MPQNGLNSLAGLNNPLRRSYVEEILGIRRAHWARFPLDRLSPSRLVAVNILLMTFWQQTARFLALKRNTSLLLATLVLALTGERLWLGFASKYLETLGAGVFIIGLFDALLTLLGAVYAYPGGWLTDRWGQRRSLLLF